MREAAATGTWAQGGAGCFLDILPLTEGAPVERCRVGAAPAPFLPAAPTAGAAHGPLSPRRPPTVHWPDREGLGSGSGGLPQTRWPRGQGRKAQGLRLCWEGSPGGEAMLCPLPLGSACFTAHSASGYCGRAGKPALTAAPRPSGSHPSLSQGQLPHALPVPAPGGAQGTTPHLGLPFLDSLCPLISLCTTPHAHK